MSYIADDRVQQIFANIIHNDLLTECPQGQVIIVVIVQDIYSCIHIEINNIITLYVMS